MSDSELSEPSAPTPPDSKLEAQLRREVQKRFKNGTTETMTVNEIRQAAEKSLGLVVGFYASHTTWKSESKRVVKDEMVGDTRLQIETYRLIVRLRRKIKLPS